MPISVPMYQIRYPRARTPRKPIKPLSKPKRKSPPPPSPPPSPIPYPKRCKSGPSPRGGAAARIRGGAEEDFQNRLMEAERRTADTVKENLYGVMRTNKTLRTRIAKAPN